MKKRFSLSLTALAILIAGVWMTFESMLVERPPAPPAHSPVVYPWGSLRLETDSGKPDAGMELSIEQSITQESPGSFDPDHDGQNEYAILVLSGGGSAGAYGAGLLAGWTSPGNTSADTASSASTRWRPATASISTWPPSRTIFFPISTR